MEQRFDKNYQPKIPVVYLGTPSHRIVCAVNGIREETFNLEDNLTDTKKISFDVDKYVEIFEKKVESNVYPLIDLLMRIYIPDIGWFVLNTPVVSNDGKSEYKSISGESEEIEMVDHDIRKLKINKGTTDSYEMLVEGNVDIIDGVEFAKEQIKFCNKEKPELSFLHILLKVSGLYGWTIGEIDSTPKEYLYYEDGELKKKYTLLSDEIGSFDIGIQDLYSFLTQDAAQYFNCIFVFDNRNLTINAYRPENYGKDTNINIGFRNLQQTNEISIDETNLFTRYTVYGSDDLGIEYVNFGSNVIENIDYFLNEKYLLADTISKYNLWKNDVEKQRPIYIENTKLYNKQLSVISELRNRVPLDDCSTDWSTFEDGELLEAQANYQAQLKGYESYYVDEDGNFDEAALQASPDANDYYQIKDVILPSIAIEIENRNLPPNTDPEDYIKTYETDWKLYGLDELDVKLETYKNRKKVLEKNGYDKPFDENTHSKDMWEKLHAEYEEILNQLNPDFVGSCKEAYNKRKQEVDDATALSEEYDKQRQIAASVVSKETWQNADRRFTDEDLADLSKLYKDGSYENSNMFLTSSDDAVTAIDEQLKLLSAAQDDLYTASQPQYIYTTSLDNFIADYGYVNYTHNLNVGDFVYLGVREGYIVKLRVVTMSYNPLTMNNNLSIVFSNMLRTKYGRNDSVYLLQSARAGSKSSSKGNSDNYDKNEGVSLTPGLIQKLLQSGAFSNKVNELINNEFAGFIGGGSGGTITIDELNAKMIKVVDIIGENGFFEYLQSKLIVTDKIVTESAEIQSLRAKIGVIDDLLAGNVSGETGQFIHLTVQNTKIDEAVIKNMIASSILVSDLKAGDITLSDSMRIISENGSMVMNGTTLQIKGHNAAGEEYVAIQLGYDKNQNPSLIIRDENGAIMLDGSGLHKEIVPDDFITTEMIGNGQVTENKIDKTGIHEWTDENGGKVFDVAQMYYGADKFDVSYTTLKETVEKTSLRLKIFASRGTVITNGNLSTELSVRLYNVDKDITDSYPDSCFVWTRESSDNASDTYWNEEHKNGEKTLVINRKDIFHGARFSCSFYFNGTKII